MFLFARARDETREQYGAVLLLGSPNTRYRRMCTDLYTQYLRVNLNLTPPPPPPRLGSRGRVLVSTSVSVHIVYTSQARVGLFHF